MKRGQKALAGIEERLRIHQFAPTDYERCICGRAEGILIYDPRDSSTQKGYRDVKPGQEIPVPPNYRVEIYEGHVYFKKPA